MLIEIRAQAFDPWRELAEYQAAISAAAGACAVFVGSMRDVNLGDSVSGMTLEHYPGMTERQLERLATTAADRHHLQDALLLHRVGDITPGEPIVLVAAWSAHRGAAFDACREMMEALKTNAPFWKKETLQDGERWLAANTPNQPPNQSPG